MSNIAVIGLGYVGLANALLLGQHESVRAFDIDKNRLEKLKARESPLEDKEIIEFLKREDLDIDFSNDFEYVIERADFIIIATPTDYDEDRHYFNTVSIEETFEKIQNLGSTATIILKSTIPVGYVEKNRKKFPSLKIIFSPEFLREGHALYDNLYPSRVVVGDKGETGAQIAHLFKENILKSDVEILLTDATEAESIKLFANTYLAMRVAFFNELDSYAELKGLNARDIIDGVSLDPRIGTHYNNPSFGYGGYCLPKDSKQLLANYDGVPQTMIKAIVDANDVRKNFIAEEVMKSSPKVVGIYRLVMKQGSDNFRQSSIQDIIQLLQEQGVEVILYEPTLNLPEYHGMKLVDLEGLGNEADVILANRMTEELKPLNKRVFTRDLFSRD